MTQTHSKKSETSAQAPKIPQTSRKKGLDTNEVEGMRRLYGSNTLSGTKRHTFIKKFVSNLGDPVIKVLLCALAVNIIFMFRDADWFESAGIAVSVFLATLISTLSEYGSEAAFEKLSEECAASVCRVRRNGEIAEINASELVYGDIVLICAGERIAADGLLIYGSVQCDQSALTGEGAEKEKYPSSDPSLHPDAPSSMCGGCVVVSGEGEMLVTQVGSKTSLGKISKEIQEDKRKSPLKERLSKLAGQISILGYIAAAFVAVVYLLNAFVFDSGFSSELIFIKLTDYHYVLSTLLSAFTLGLTVVVMAVPEGLPMMIAVVLSSNIRKMVKDNVLIRRPVGIEAAGSMNILFTDKTGTLTRGKLGVDEIILADCTTFDNIKSIKSADASSCFLSGYCINALFNTPAKIVSGHSSGGNATDSALMESAVGEYNQYSCIKTISKITFNSSAKYSAVTVYDAAAKKKRTFVKGAPERLLPYITECECKGGAVSSFGIYKKKFDSVLRELTAKGSRVIIVAECVSENDDCSSIGKGNFPRLSLICAVSLRDRLRGEAKKSVEALRLAGIRVVMITGDNKATASDIARRCGIIGGGVDICITSDEMAAMSDSSLKELLPSLAVVARALPHDKSRLVRIAQDMGLVVGMTGDGINDAPALRHADVGFAIGSGTQVAKDASDIIILDNNLASIVKAVLYGRTIFKSIRKFIVLQLTMNFCAVGVSMIGPFIGVDAPITVIQMLWINIIMDTLGGLAFAGEPALPSYMKDKPKKRDEPILNRYMVNEIVFLGGATIALLIGFLRMPQILSLYRASGDNIYILTAFFALFIFSGVFNCFNARTDRLNLLSGLGKNPAFIGIMSAVCFIQILFIYLGGEVLRTAPLSLNELRLTMLFALPVFPIEFIRKILWRAFGKKGGY